MSGDVCMKHQQEDTPENPCRDCIIEAIRPPVPEFEYALVHKGEPTGVQTLTRREAMDAGVELMKTNPEWDFVEVRDLTKDSRAGGVWRNKKEGRLIRSKELG
jgi:hypothetical protein